MPKLPLAGDRQETQLDLGRLQVEDRRLRERMSSLAGAFSFTPFSAVPGGSITAGIGLSGGGALPASVSLEVDLSYDFTWTGDHTFSETITAEDDIQISTGNWIGMGASSGRIEFDSSLSGEVAIPDGASLVLYSDDLSTSVITLDGATGQINLSDDVVFDTAGRGLIGQTNTAGYFWRCDGTRAYPAPIQAGDLPSIDHGGLSGLNDDDHTIYLLIAGTRAMTGNLDLDGNSLILDTDGNSYLAERSDNLIDMYLGGSQALLFRLRSGDPSLETNQSNLILRYDGAGPVQVFSATSEEDLNLYGNLNIDQGALDDAIITLASSDVAHGMTDYIGTDIYGHINKFEAAAGGLVVRGLKDANGGNYGALSLQGFLGESAETTKPITTSSRAIIEMVAAERSGSGVAAAAANANIFSIRNFGTTRFVVDAEGDVFRDGSMTTYDDYDDALMVRDLAQVLAGQYHKVIEHNRETFERLGIIGPPDQDGNFMISTKRMNALMLGAIGQLWQRMKLLEAGDGV